MENPISDEEKAIIQKACQAQEKSEVIELINSFMNSARDRGQLEVIRSELGKTIRSVASPELQTKMIMLNAKVEQLRASGILDPYVLAEPTLELMNDPKFLKLMDIVGGKFFGITRENPVSPPANDYGNCGPQ